MPIPKVNNESVYTITLNPAEVVMDLDLILSNIESATVDFTPEGEEEPISRVT